MEKLIKMKLIIISGPTGSGKTTLSKKILEKVSEGIVLSTDNYYKTGLVSKILSRFFENYFDRKISLNDKLFIKDFNFIMKTSESTHNYLYDFNNKTTKKFFHQKKNIKFLILEGIFAKELIKELYKKNYFFIELKINKSTCMNRVIKRDIIERGKNLRLAKRNFLSSWDIYYSHNKKNNLRTNCIEIIYSKEKDLEHIFKKILI